MAGWVRLWHDMPTDPKWRAIARKSGQPLPCVIALFNLIMVNASDNDDERGTLCNWDNEDAAAALDMEPEGVTAIMDAMQGKVLEGDRLTGWEKRQPKREDEGAAARKRLERERKKDVTENASRNVTQCHAPDTDTDTDTDTEKKNNKGDFAFAGAVIRLRRDDFSRWSKAYSDLDLRAVLQARDDWLNTQPEPERKRWFNSTSNFLAKKQQEARTAKKSEAVFSGPC